MEVSIIDRLHTVNGRSRVGTSVIAGTNTSPVQLDSDMVLVTLIQEDSTVFICGNLKSDVCLRPNLGGGDLKVRLFVDKIHTDQFFTLLSLVARQTLAYWLIYPDDALSSVLTIKIITGAGPRENHGRRKLTEQATVAFRADARIAIHRIGAVGSIFTLVVLAVVKVNVAVLTDVSWRAVTLESLWRQDALGVVLAGVQVLGTEVQLLLTQLACVLRWAKARVVINSIDACRVIFTVIIFTVINIDFTIFSFKSISTNTPESIFFSFFQVASSSMFTWVTDACMNWDITVLALETIRAGAAIKVNGIIVTGAIVFTGI